MFVCLFVFFFVCLVCLVCLFSLCWLVRLFCPLLVGSFVRSFAVWFVCSVLWWLVRLIGPLLAVWFVGSCADWFVYSLVCFSLLGSMVCDFVGLSFVGWSVCWLVG